MNIFLIPFTPLRHTSVAVVCAACCLLTWWLILAMSWEGAPWSQEWDGAVFLGALAASAGGGSVLAEGSLRRQALWKRMLLASLGTVLSLVFALGWYWAWTGLVGPLLLGKELVDPSLVSLRYRVMAWVAAGFGAGLATMLVRRFRGGLSHVVGGVVAGMVGGLVWYVAGYSLWPIGKDLFYASAFGATAFGFTFGLLTWGVPDELYAGWLRVLSVTRHSRRIPVDAADGSARERFVGHFPRGLDLFLPAEDGVMELHASVLLNKNREFRVRGLTLQPTTVRRFLERIDLSYDKNRPAPLDTRLYSGDRIVMGPAGNQTVVEFLMLPREER
ncbi:hypothetical protein LBMAG42_43260 [Deltaproteobacteria bacterium]|nr:hypothetical protein LBMAG42_43260 [Deltaproteobacteria bacterium]